MTFICSSNPDSYLNRARRLLYDGKQEWAAANRGEGSRRKANKMMAEARIQLRQVLYNRKPRKRYWSTFPIEVAGIPCEIYLTHYDPDEREVEYVLCDRDGYEAGEWLTGKVSKAELDAEVLRVVERTE